MMKYLSLLKIELKHNINWIIVIYLVNVMLWKQSHMIEMMNRSSKKSKSEHMKFRRIDFFTFSELLVFQNIKVISSFVQNSYVFKFDIFINDVEFILFMDFHLLRWNEKVDSKRRKMGYPQMKLTHLLTHHEISKT